MQRYDMEIWKDWNEEGLYVDVAVARKSVSGRWVQFKDAAKLQDRIDALESELEEIRQQGV